MHSFSNSISLPKEPGSQGKIEGLEIIRACAALIVFLGHGFQHELFPQIIALKMVFNYATEAVIIFFVLSGAVIALTS
jgi:peptidoglycan/LPS O-acetylase OafA/YrhL